MYVEVSDTNMRDNSNVLAPWTTNYLKWTEGGTRSQQQLRFDFQAIHDLGLFGNK